MTEPNEICTDEIPEDIREAYADCLRRGWLRDLGGGRFEITDKGRREVFEQEAFAAMPPSTSSN
jgi:hypothetical protein